MREMLTERTRELRARIAVAERIRKAGYFIESNPNYYGYCYNVKKHKGLFKPKLVIGIDVPALCVDYEKEAEITFKNSSNMKGNVKEFIGELEDATGLELVRYV